MELEYTQTQMEQPDASRRNAWRELFCIGSVPSVLRHFTRLTGWTLTYHYADSCPWANDPSGEFSFGDNIDPSGQICVGPVPEEEQLPNPLTPDNVREIFETEKEWLPIEIHSPIFPEMWKDLEDSPFSFMTHPIGFLHLHSDDGTNDPKSRAKFEEAHRFASAIADFIAEMQTVRAYIWLVEIQEMGNTSIFNRRFKPERATFARRFRTLLDFALGLLDLEAVAIYLFDNSGRRLKMRASAGLPLQSAMSKSRSLGEAQTDMEALHRGVIFVLDESAPPPRPQPPENFRTAICLPLVTDRSQLGTVWFFSNRLRYLPEAMIKQTQLLADHFALDIERESFFRRYGRAMEYHADLRRAAEIQGLQAQPPFVWKNRTEFCGWSTSERRVINPFRQNEDGPDATEDDAALQGGFYEWFPLSPNSMGAVLCDVGVPGLPGAVLSAAVRAVLRCQSRSGWSASNVLEKVHDAICDQFKQDAQISLLCCRVSHENSFTSVQFAQMGNFCPCRTLANSATYRRVVPEGSLAAQRCLGNQQEFHCFEDVVYLTRGESFFVLNDGQGELFSPIQRKYLCSSITTALLDKCSMKDIQKILESHATPEEGRDASFLLVRETEIAAS
ncbi:MAG: GAF domain-containing protein [Planctomycetia bacterium]|nr:GAF domain-containing protein [Planctomycetia bacterium]